MFGLSENALSIIQNELSLHAQIEQASIFGSRAKGNYKPGSDIDIAIIGKKADALLALNINGKLNESSPLPFHFDIVNYNDISNPDLKAQIDRVGIIFYQRKK